MKILYSDTGFEQDIAPQLLIEGTSAEFENFIKTIEPLIQKDNQGELIKIQFEGLNGYELFLFNKVGDNQLIKKIDEKRYKMSLDASLWYKVIGMLKPLVTHLGYQFIEFNESSIIEDVGLIFRAVL
jgi:hypothetical protein